MGLVNADVSHSRTIRAKYGRAARKMPHSEVGVPIEASSGTVRR